MALGLDAEIACTEREPWPPTFHRWMNTALTYLPVKAGYGRPARENLVDISVYISMEDEPLPTTVVPVAVPVLWQRG
jgi:hypothetical protein